MVCYLPPPALLSSWCAVSLPLYFQLCDSPFYAKYYLALSLSLTLTLPLLHPDHHPTYTDILPLSFASCRIHRIVAILLAIVIIIIFRLVRFCTLATAPICVKNNCTVSVCRCPCSRLLYYFNYFPLPVSPFSSYRHHHCHHFFFFSCLLFVIFTDHCEYYYFYLPILHRGIFPILL